MEKETVLEIEFKELWDDKFAWRISKNELLRPKRKFEDYEIGTTITINSKDYATINLDTDDDYVIDTNVIINEKIKNKLECILEKINEKYGILKIWRAEKGSYYYYIDKDFEINDKIDDRFKSDDEMYKNGNYFQTTEEAEEYAEYMKKRSLEWHERKENNE